MSTFVGLRGIAISVDEVLARVQHAGAGGVSVFLGVVRDTNDGKHVVKLEYEAYESMAVAEMERIAAEIVAEVPDSRVAVLHRIGTLVVGDAAVVCAASAPHRAEAFTACRLLIDRIKSRVPIWKREYGPEGAHWVGWQDARCHQEGHEHR
jgi:molybdopterin synthase catalytic subunit